MNKEELAKSKLRDRLNTADTVLKYVHIIKSSLIPMAIIFVISMVITFIYLKNTISIYNATTVIKVDPPTGNILEANIFKPVDWFGNKEYIQNQIEILSSFYMRENVADALIDSIKNRADKSIFYNLIDRKKLPEVVPIPKNSIVSSLIGLGQIEQKEKLEAIMISSQGPSFAESQLITSTYAKQYIEFGLKSSKKDISTVKAYLEGEKEKKQKELAQSETDLEDFYRKTGSVYLDDEAKQMIENVSSNDAAVNNIKTELSANQKVLAELKNEVDKSDPRLTSYVDAQLNEPFLRKLQEQIGNLELKRDNDLSLITDPDVKARLTASYQKQLEGLYTQLNQRLDVAKSGLIAQTPLERQALMSQYLQRRLDNISLGTKLSSLNGILGNYESKLSKLPQEVIELARLQRIQKSNEKLYTLLEGKYQEAEINERSRVGNAYILDPGLENFGPIKPDKRLIYIQGIFIGLGLGLAFAFGRYYLDRTVKSPEEIEKIGATVLAWIPIIEEFDAKAKKGGKATIVPEKNEFIVLNKPKSVAAESFKALRTRVQYSKLGDNALKTILVTSSIPGEGKSLVSVNLAGSFAQIDKKILLIDCDLRKPRIHSIFNAERYPGISDYLFNTVGLDDVIRKTGLPNLDFITCGTIPPNPSELLASMQMREFFEDMKKKYDLVIIDSPPVISVTDSEILFNVADGTILVSRADKTPIEAFLKVYLRLIDINEKNLLGAVINNFSFKKSYGYYYNYYYTYSIPDVVATTKKDMMKKPVIEPQAVESNGVKKS